MKTDELFAQITDALLVKMEAGKLPWHKPWSAETAAPHNLTGRAHSTVLDFISAKAIGEIVVANLSKEAVLMTDEARHYVKLGQTFASHGHTNHGAGEYVSRFNPQVHTNTVEGFFSIFKRGMRGVYQHCGKKHLHRYLAEFDFRYSYRIALGVNDEARTNRAIEGVIGKRITYRGGANQRSQATP